MAKAKNFATPKGEIVWVYITGEGKEDMNGNPRYSASLRLKNDSPELAKIKADINEYWKEHKPKGMKQKSNGIREEKTKDDDGEETLTGYSLVNFWTGIAFPDGKPKVVPVYNAKQVKVDLGDKRIGNGTIGHISGAMSLYTIQSKGKISQAGITLYLNAIQIVKFEEYQGSTVLASVDEEDEEDGWTGVDEETGFEPQNDEPKPSLSL